MPGRLTQYNREIDAIKSNSEPPTLKNTVEALEFALNGDLRLFAKYLDTVANSNTDDDISKLNEKISGQNAAIETKTIQDEALFARFKAIHDAKDTLGLTPAQSRLLEKTYTKFARSGALLGGACDNDPAKSKKQRLQEIDARLTELGKRFSANETDPEGSYRKFILDEKKNWTAFRSATKGFIPRRRRSRRRHEGHVADPARPLSRIWYSHARHQPRAARGTGPRGQLLVAVAGKQTRQQVRYPGRYSRCAS